MRIFITDEFQGFMKRAKLSNSDVVKATIEINSGLIDANLGGVIKKRISAFGFGKRSAGRCIVAYVQDERCFFIDGWRKSDIPKSGKEIPDTLLETYRLIGKSLVKAPDWQIKKDLMLNLLKEVIYD